MKFISMLFKEGNIKYKDSSDSHGLENIFKIIIHFCRFTHSNNGAKNIKDN